MLKYDVDFAIPVKAAGLVPRDCLAEYPHWQIRGGDKYPFVNCWANTKLGFKFQAIGGPPIITGTVREAIDLAGPPEKPAAGLAKIAPFDMSGDPEERQVGFIRWYWRKIW